MTNFELFFLNDETIILQTPEYCHQYDDIKDLELDVIAYIVDGNTSSWKGNNPNNRIVDKNNNQIVKFFTGTEVLEEIIHPHLHLKLYYIYVKRFFNLMYKYSEILY